MTRARRLRRCRACGAHGAARVGSALAAARGVRRRERLPVHEHPRDRPDHHADEPVVPAVRRLVPRQHGHPPRLYDQSDLRRGAQALGRAPKACASARVDPHALEALEPCHKRLLQGHGQAPGPELLPVGVPRQLKMEEVI